MPLFESAKPTEIIERLDVPYEEYINWQTEQILKRKAETVSDVVSIMSFSKSVYTKPDGVETDNSINLTMLPAKRGGGETWHGPGQLIISPVVRLHRDFLISDFIDLIEAPVRQTLLRFGVTPDPKSSDDFPGVSVEGRKIAQLGLFLDDRVTSYGIAFNVTCDLTKFEAINLCGIEDCPVTNLQSEVDRSIEFQEVFQTVVSETTARFHHEDWMA